jgi:hypothetical protein
MTPEQLLKKHNISKVYAYSESKVDNNKIEFGWVESDLESADGKFVISYGSKSKKIDKSDIEWSKVEGKNLITLIDYESYFSALTGMSTADFLKKWEGRVDILESHWSERFPNARPGEGEFLLMLANLAINDKKFTKFGRIFKIIDSST